MEQRKFYQIKNITEHEYTLVGCNGSVITRPIQDIDKSASAFTIQDAKDGDVLVAKIGAEPNDFIYILKEHNQNLGFWSHCYLDAHINKFHEGIYHNNRNIGVPATKEQRDMFFQKMHEAGYEWDAEIKELKKSEQKPAWSEEDEEMINAVIAAIRFTQKEHNHEVSQIVYEREIDWLKSLKDRV